MTDTDKIALGALFLSIISTAVTIYNNRKVNTLERDKINYEKIVDKENTLQTLKKSIKEYRIVLHSILKNNQQISYIEKDIYSIDSDFSLEKIKTCLGINIYNKYLDLEVEIDEALSSVIYRQDFNKIPPAIKSLGYFIDKLNNIVIK